jgi:hypothetical protein
VNRHLYIIFVLLAVFFLVTMGLILRREMNPEWKRYQEAFFLKEKDKVTKALARADKTQRTKLQKRLNYLNHPQYRIRQILLDGGSRVDRCNTCHLDLKELEKKHPEIERFPFEEYGCTVCHGGVGRATEESAAHSTLHIPRRPLYEYLEASNSGTSALDLFKYSASGERIQFTGSNLCLRCHLSSHPRHVARWRKLKFKPLDKVKEKLKELQSNGISIDESQCFDCHTTGFNQQTGHYLEDRVTCEGCHGPGGFYTELMAGGRARDGAELARNNIFKTQADRVCLNCHRPDRHKDYEKEDLPPTVISVSLDGKPAPKMDGSALDDTWAVALETEVPTWQLGNGPVRPGATVFIRSVYDDTHIYFTFRWRDKTRHDQMGQWRFNNGRWQAEMDSPDAFALQWQITEQVKDFKLGGCAVLCHNTGRYKEFPRMATREKEALVDEWYWNAFAAKKGRRPGDGFLDHQSVFIPKGSKKPPLRWAIPELSAAHGSDASGARMPETIGGIPLVLNARETKEKLLLPKFHLEGGKRVPLQLSDGTEPIRKTLPLYEFGLPEGGDSADISGQAIWAEGYWVLELSRALLTSDKLDVQFDPSKKNYPFGLAIWDGDNGDRHQVATIVILRFASGETGK